MRSTRGDVGTAGPGEWFFHDEHATLLAEG